METNLQNEPYDDSRMNHFRCLSFEAQAGAQFVDWPRPA
jgi:hypothetical protein